MDLLLELILIVIAVGLLIGTLFWATMDWLDSRTEGDEWGSEDED